MFLYDLIYACIKIQRASNYQKVQLTNLVVNEGTPLIRITIQKKVFTID